MQPPDECNPSDTFIGGLRFLIGLPGALQHTQRKADAVTARLQKSQLPRLLFLIGWRATEFSPAQRQGRSKFIIGFARGVLRQRGSGDVFVHARALEFLRDGSLRKLARTLAYQRLGVARIGKPAALGQIIQQCLQFRGIIGVAAQPFFQFLPGKLAPPQEPQRTRA